MTNPYRKPHDTIRTVENSLFDVLNWGSRLTDKERTLVSDCLDSLRHARGCMRCAHACANKETGE